MQKPATHRKSDFTVLSIFYEKHKRSINLKKEMSK
jgi:hypothetical protein